VHRERRLAHARGTGDGRDDHGAAGLGQHRVQPAQLVRAAGEPGQVAGQLRGRPGVTGGRRRAGRAGRLAPQDGLLQPLQRRTGIQAQLLGQAPAGAGVGVQRVGRTAGAVQREHRQLDEALPGRVLGGQPGQLRQQRPVPAQLQVGRRGLLDGVQAQLLQVGAEPVPEPLVGRVVQGRAAPQGERVAQQPATPGRIGGTGGRLDQPPELVRVHRLGRDGEQVAAPVGDQRDVVLGGAGPDQQRPDPGREAA
jgi:hypothetical protein